MLPTSTPQQKECIDRLSMALSSEHLLGINPQQYLKLRRVLTQYNMVSRVPVKTAQQRQQRQQVLAGLARKINHLYFTKNSVLHLQGKGRLKPGQSVISHFKGHLQLKPYADPTASAQSQRPLLGQLIIQVNKAVPKDYWLERMRISGMAKRQGHRYTIKVQ